tara:strand:+ start:7746 stop:8036 length:291 start_codon:yes stop_codon:yes gene_type:complete
MLTTLIMATMGSIWYVHVKQYRDALKAYRETDLNHQDVRASHASLLRSWLNSARYGHLPTKAVQLYTQELVGRCPICAHKIDTLITECPSCERSMF